MSSRRVSINASSGNEDNEQPLTYASSNGTEDPIIGINTIDEQERETKPLLDEYNVEPSSGGYFLCANIPARYTIAIWAFLGFFCLYAMRVNLSVAIVAMVSMDIIQHKK
jgi:hypothetical protein